MKRRVLFDENMPHKLRRDLPEFTVSTVQEEGFSGLRNGDLLSRAAGRFDVLVTLDQRLRYQQNLSALRIGIVVIEMPDTRLVHVRALVPQLRQAIADIAVGEVTLVKPSQPN